MQMSFEQLAGKLLFNSLKYDRAKKTGEPLKLVAVSIAITGRCNSRCIHCRIWELSQKNPAAIKHEMTKEEICVYLSDQWFSDLVEIDLTGGEPYLRDDIEDIVAGIMALRKSKLTKLRTIIIPTNGLLTEKILSRMKVILSLLKGTGVDFVSVSSLDGLGRAHDLMRGTKGAFEKADKTIEGILKLREEYPDGFWPGIKTTITHYNVHELHSLLNYAVARSMFYIISPVIITKKRFRNEKFKDKFQLSIEDLKKIAEFYTNRKHEFDFYYQKVLASIMTGKMQWDCTALFNYLFIDYDRKIYPCPIHDVCVGDLSKATVGQILESETAMSVRRKVGAYPLCRQCTEPGAVRYSQVLEGKSLLAFIQAKGRENYAKVILDRGLDKLLFD